MNNLSQIGKALLQYEAVHRRFPSLYTTDDNGQPLVSWRASILPQLGCQGAYEECHLNERWDSPANAELIGYDLPFFRCPSDSRSLPGQTSYLAVVGPGTVWSTDEPVSLDDIADTSRTILLVEAAGSGISWLEPRDLPLEDALREINAEPGPSISGGHSGGVVVLFADGHVEFLRESIALVELRELLMVEKR